MTKRLFQLTGHRVPDHNLPNVKDVQSLLRMVQKPPKPKTLNEEIKRRQELPSMPNVQISAKRVTRGQKDQALGRFKLIARELEKRGLPLRGHGGAQKGREVDIINHKL